MTIHHEISRREWLQSVASLGFAIYIAPANSAEPPAIHNGLQPNAWIRILADDSVVIAAAASELGQGSMTALPLLVAEELDADWAKVRIEMSPVSDALYGNPRIFNLMLTIASSAVSGYYQPLRIAGARARLSMMLAAAEIWNVPISEITTQPNLLVHKPSNRQMTYGELAGKVKQLPAPPELTFQQLKPASSFRLIGRDVVRRDLAAKVNGSADYALNASPPGLLHATVIRSPVYGATVQGFDAKRVSPRIQIKRIGDDAIAVIGQSMSAVLAAREQVKVRWTNAAAESFSDSEARPKYIAAAQNTGLVTRVWDKKGDALAAQSTASKSLEREYASDYFYHAQIEPLNAVASVAADGSSATVWAGTQAPSYAVNAVARALGIPADAVTLHRSLSGGAFGRRGSYDQEYVVDAALLSRDLGKPVKVIWSRGEDISAGRFKPMTAQWLRAGVSAEGAVVSWRHRVACEDPLVMADPPRYKARNESPAIAMLGTNIPSYGIPNQLIEYARQPISVRVAPMRGVGAPVNRFAVECFVDEIAEELSLDPLAYRRQLLKDSPRGLQVLERVAALSGWGTTSSGRAKGMAYSDYGGAFIALVADISVDRSSGVIRVHQVWASLDAGTVIQPDTTKASIEGGIIFGTSMAIKERMTFKAGRAQQSSFLDYPILRMTEAPDIEVELIASEAPPAGVAEASPIVAPAAIANAFARLTKRRIRAMPLHAERVLQALKG